VLKLHPLFLRSNTIKSRPGLSCTDTLRGGNGRCWVHQELIGICNICIGTYKCQEYLSPGLGFSHTTSLLYNRDIAAVAAKVPRYKQYRVCGESGGLFSTLLGLLVFSH